MFCVDPRDRLLALMSLPENSRCADCQCEDPRWASCNLGVVICISCSGIHRGLGTHVSFVRSCTLDRWKEDEIATLERVGNARANAYWEANLPHQARPPPDDLGLMTKFIRRKYELAQWADPAARPPHLLHRRRRRRNAQRQVVLADPFDPPLPEPEPQGAWQPACEFDEAAQMATWAERAIGGVMKAKKFVMHKIDCFIDRTTYTEPATGALPIAMPHDVTDDLIDLSDPAVSPQSAKRPEQDWFDLTNAAFPNGARPRRVAGQPHPMAAREAFQELGTVGVGWPPAVSACPVFSGLPARPQGRPFHC
jgi:stromal membrane-associated protein